MALVSVLTSDFDSLRELIFGSNTKGIVCGSADATSSPQNFFSYTQGSFSLQSCVAECPTQHHNITLCTATLVSTACLPPCQEQQLCEQENTYNITTYPTQQVMQYCVPDPEAGLAFDHREFFTTAERNFRYEVGSLSLDSIIQAHSTLKDHLCAHMLYSVA